MTWTAVSPSKNRNGQGTHQGDGDPTGHLGPGLLGLALVRAPLRGQCGGRDMEREPVREDEPGAGPDDEEHEVVISWAGRRAGSQRG